MYAIDFLKGCARASESRALIETSLDEVHRVFDELTGVDLLVQKYSQLQPGEMTLQQHVKRMMKTPESCIGPASETCVVYKSPRHSMPQLKAMNLQEAGMFVSASWKTASAFKKVLTHHDSSTLLSFYCLINLRLFLLFKIRTGKQSSRALHQAYFPLLSREECIFYRLGSFQVTDFFGSFGRSF